MFVFAVKSGRFTKVEGHGEVAHVRSDAEEVTRTCNDGYVPGNVIVRNIPQREVYVPSQQRPSPCDSFEEIDVRRSAQPVPYPAFQYSSSASHSAQSSSSSCASKTKNTVYLSRLEN